MGYLVQPRRLANRAMSTSEAYQMPFCLAMGFPTPAPSSAVATWEQNAEYLTYPAGDLGTPVQPEMTLSKTPLWSGRKNRTCFDAYETAKPFKAVSDRRAVSR